MLMLDLVHSIICLVAGCGHVILLLFFTWPKIPIMYFMFLSFFLWKISNNLLNYFFKKIKCIFQLQIKTQTLKKCIYSIRTFLHVNYLLLHVYKRNYM